MPNTPIVPKGYIQSLRNIGIIAHIDAGKTTLSERILYFTGKIHRMGEVHEGTATMDFMPEEQERGITIGSACTTCTWGPHTINVIDTPGHVDFTIEVERSLRVLDGAVGVFCAVGGVEPQSETVWRQSEKYHVPKLAFVNKMDRIGANFEAVLDAMRERLGASPLAMQIPVGAGPEFTGVIDIVGMRYLVFDEDKRGGSYEAFDLTPEQAELAAPWRDRLIDVVSEANDAILEAALSGEDPARELIDATVRELTVGLKIVPVYAGSALRNIGVQPLLDAVCAYLPSPLEVVPQTGTDALTKKRITMEPSPQEPLSVLAFKVNLDSGHKLVLMRVYSGVLESGQVVWNATQQQEERVAHLYRVHAGHREKIERAVAGEIVAAAGMKFARTGDTLCTREHPVILEHIEGYKPVISLALEPRSSAEAERLEEVMRKLLLEDPTLDVKIDEETEQLVLSGMGELHLDVVLDRVRREFNVDPRVGKPQVVYQETVGQCAPGEGEFDRELGDVEHYGFVSLTVEPLPRQAGRDIVLEVDPEAWPTDWLDAVAEGIEDGLQSGVVRGYPVQDVRVIVRELRRVDGKSSTVGYRMAAALALKQALAQATPKLLEPIMNVEVNVPDEFVGEVIGLFGTKGARIGNMFDVNGQKIVQALTPLRQLFGFSTQLRSVTQGRAGLIMKFARFDVLG
ncbi:elongation factor G [Desulfobaculum xiamenense]|uniref:Elongation factor G n=1 Tax=Desulfobaculum xiamenense TaxID=995050 RepID=A0A846QF57_9BACT|nr:elongation factor G [Desulfobaculum xiamenense]NJB66891.1 elongation factor G [Desulfobaculum xiamenense]